MNGTNLFKIALRALANNKLRAFLTMLGIIIGVASVITMLAIGQGSKKSIQAQISEMGSNMIMIHPGADMRGGVRQDPSSMQTLKLTDYESLRDETNFVSAVSPEVSSSGQLIAGNNNYPSSVSGVGIDYLEIRQLNVEEGEMFTEADIQVSAKVCVIGKRIYKELFPGGGDPCGQFIKVENSYYRIVGVNYGGSNISMGGDPETTIQVPFPVLQKAQNYGNRVDALALTAHSGYRISTLEPQIRQIIYRAHYVDPDDKFASFIFSAELMFTMMDNLFRGVRFLIWLVGLGTLLAGVVGVSNIMMVTVKERTVEFGIRRAIGARPTDILLQVILESLLLTVLAGMAGITFAVFVLQCLELANTVDGIPTAQFQVSFGFAVGAACLVALLGIVAGLAPALRALHIKPVDAMRDE